MSKGFTVLIVVMVMIIGMLTGCGGKKIGGMSEADFIEVNAQIMALSSTETDYEKMEAKMEAILKKYGTTQEEITKISTGPDADKMRQTIGPKIMKRAQELGFKMQ